MANLRKLAKGRECQIRIPGVCSGSSETVVLCHLPGGGMGAKRHDIHGAYGCSDCHDYVDGRRHLSNHPSEQFHRQIWFFEAVIRTQEILLAEGMIKT